MKNFKATFNSNTKVNINGKDYAGRNIVINGKTVIVDGVKQDEVDQINVTVNITGNVETCESASGNICVSGSSGYTKTVSGDIRTGSVTGDVKTVSGDVHADQIKGSVKTVSGDIRGKI